MILSVKSQKSVIIKWGKLLVIYDFRTVIILLVVQLCFAVFDDRSLFIQTLVLATTNQTTVSQVVLHACSMYNVDYNNVLAFVSDNGAYCKKAVREVLLPFCSNAVHICCLAHICNLVGEEWKFAKSLKLLLNFVIFFKSAFKKKGARKWRFQLHMQACGLDSTLAPTPVSTMWKTHFKRVEYHTQRLGHYLNIFIREQQTSSSVAVDRLVDMLENSFLDLESPGFYL